MFQNVFLYLKINNFRKKVEMHCTILDEINFILSSPELKGQVSFSDRLLSVICPFVWLSIRL